MPIEFSRIPADWKMPLYWVEIDPSMAGLPTTRQPCLLVGQMSSDGKATANVPVAVNSLAQAKDAFGAGSMLASMFERFMRNNFSHEMWAMPIDNLASGGTKSSGTITVSQKPSASGTLHLYIAGRMVPVNIGSSDTAAQVATKIMTAINANTDLPVTALISSDSDAAVSLACKWAGVTGDDIDMRHSYKGAIAGESLPAGLIIAFSGNGKLSGGAGEPDFTAAIEALSDEAYEYVAMPYTDGNSLDAWVSEFSFEDTGRWGYLRQAFGLVFSSKREPSTGLGDLLIWGATNNSGIISFMAIEAQSPSPVWDWSAAYCAKAGRALANDPARPLQTLELVGCLSAPKHQRFSTTDLNTMAGRGLATQRLGPNGNPVIMRETTSYQLNLYGQGDDAYELVTTLATLAKLIRNQRGVITSKFPRHKLADDGTRFGVGQAIVTPSIIKAELVAQYRVDEFNGLVENVRAFKDNLSVERDPNDPDRVNVVYPPDLINQLRVFAVLAQFRLQYDRGVDTIIAA